MLLLYPKVSDFAKVSTFEERLSPAGERCHDSGRVGNVALRSTDGEGSFLYKYV